MTEYNFLIYDGNKQPIHPTLPGHGNHSGPYLPQWMYMAQAAIRQRGGHVDAAHYLHQWVTDHPDLHDMHYTPLWFQASPWRQGDDLATQTENEVGSVMREDLLVGSHLAFFSIFVLNPCHPGFHEGWTPITIGNRFS